MLDVVRVLRDRQETVVRANSKAEGSPADLDGRHRLGRFVWEIASQSRLTGFASIAVLAALTLAPVAASAASPAVPFKESGRDRRHPFA